MKSISVAALVSQVLVVLGFWAWNHIHFQTGNQFEAGATAKLLMFGRLAGLLAAVGILLQLTLIGRARRIEQEFGLDRLSRIHHVLGFTLLAALIAHPVLVTLGHAAQADVSFVSQLADFFTVWDDVGAAMVALVLILAAMFFSVLILRKFIRYEFWYSTHLVIYLAIALALGHQLEKGTDLAMGPAWVRGYWIGLNSIVLASLLGYRFIRPLWIFHRHRFAVVRVVAETGDVNSVYIEGRDMVSFRIEAGQFMIVRFLSSGFRLEAHPFSMSCVPDGRQLRLTIKALGDFTKRIPSITPGTPVLIDGPYGVFTGRKCRSDKVLMIAGGIGITPLRSLAGELVAAGRDVVLIYGSRNHNGIVFNGELADLERESSGRFRVVHVLSDDPEWQGERGRVDSAMIARLVPDLKVREVYLCGPPLMMRLVRRTMIELDVDKAMIHYESFKL